MKEIMIKICAKKLFTDEDYTIEMLDFEQKAKDFCDDLDDGDTIWEIEIVGSEDYFKMDSEEYKKLQKEGVKND
jgi:hypothetical protein